MIARTDAGQTDARDRRNNPQEQPGDRRNVTITATYIYFEPKISDRFPFSSAKRQSRLAANHQRSRGVVTLTGVDALDFFAAPELHAQSLTAEGVVSCRKALCLRASSGLAGNHNRLRS